MSQEVRFVVSDAKRKDNGKLTADIYKTVTEKAVEAQKRMSEINNFFAKVAEEEGIEEIKKAWEEMDAGRRGSLFLELDRLKEKERKLRRTLKRGEFLSFY